jgi:hypothetical protein
MEVTSNGIFYGLKRMEFFQNQAEVTAHPFTVVLRE